MTLITSEHEKSSEQELLSVAENHFARLIGAVEVAINAVENGEDSDARAAAGLSRDLSKSLQTLFDERSRIEKLRKNAGGVVHDFALDFDAARVEIGRRLARLRDAQDAGSVSE